MAKPRALLLILVLALGLRLAFALTQDPNAPYLDRRNDAGWYLGNAYSLLTGNDPPDMVNDVSKLASPPLYFIVIGLPQVLLSPAGAVIFIRVLQALLSTATCYFAYRLALVLTRRENAGLIVAALLAISPVFIVESAQILTETLYIFLIAGGLWLYLEWVLPHPHPDFRETSKQTVDFPPSPRLRGRGEADLLRTSFVRTVSRGEGLPLLPNINPRPIAWLLLAALLFGLAALTRAVLLGFPFVLVIHLLLVRGRRAWRCAALFLLAFALVVSTWTIYSLARWNRFVIAGEGLPAFFYMGATGISGAEQVDQSLQPVSGDYVEGAQAAISSDPLGWVKHRVSELVNAYLQPHGTTFYPGASLKDQALRWLHEDRSLSGLIALTQGDYFWPKLTLYVLHYLALLAGLAGMWLYRRARSGALPMIGFIIYVTLVHLALLALPRYLFPNEIFWWIFAAAALERLTRRRLQPTTVR
ncbi:MAG: phospholipid carrier-dependent glycosyltransferase [Chloroflexi bacterium]|nr:phospholipid carrier-dependent glycosyltransferase [Chloroflexota bacterium]